MASGIQVGNKFITHALFTPELAQDFHASVVEQLSGTANEGLVSLDFDIAMKRLLVTPEEELNFFGKTLREMELEAALAWFAITRTLAVRSISYSCGEISQED